MVGGVAERVDVSEGEAKVGLETDGCLTNAGGEDCFLGVEVGSLSTAFLNRLLKPDDLAFSGSDADVGAWERGEGRAAAGLGVLVALAMGPARSGCDTRCCS